MKQIESYGPKVRNATDVIGPVEADPEYQLIVEANDLAADIDNEVVGYLQAIFVKLQEACVFSISDHSSQVCERQISEAVS